MKTLPGKDYCFGSYAQQRENPHKLYIYSSNLNEDGTFWPSWSDAPWCVVGMRVTPQEFSTHAEAIAHAHSEAIRAEQAEHLRRFYA